MKIAASFFILFLISGISMASAASIISIELDSDTLVAGEIVELTGSVESNLAGKPIGVELKDSEGNVILIRTITSNSDGVFTLKFKVPPSASGELEIVTSVEIDGQPFSESVSAEVIDTGQAVDLEPEPEPLAQPVAEPEVKSQTSVECGEGLIEVDGICRFAPESEGCGEGTVMVNGVCQLAPTQTKTSFMSIEPIYLIIGAVGIGGVIAGVIAVAKRGSGTPKPRREELDEYESRYVSKQRRRPTRRRPARVEETSSSCSNCGNKLRPTAKFCGGCGTKV